MKVPFINLSEEKNKNFSNENNNIENNIISDEIKLDEEENKKENIKISETNEISYNNEEDEIDYKNIQILNQPKIEEYKNNNNNENNNLSNRNCCNKMFFTWAYNIIKLSSKNNLKLEYLSKLPDDYKSNYFYNNIYYIWNNKGYKYKKYLPLLQCSIRSNLFEIIIIFIFTIINVGLNYFSITYFRLLMQQFKNKSKMTQENLMVGIIYLLTYLNLF